MNAKHFFAIGTISAMVGGLFFAFYQQKSEQQLKQLIDDNILEKFIRNLKSQCFPHFFLVAGIVTRMKNESKDESEYGIIFQKVLPEVEILFQKKQQMILAKYELQLPDVLQSIQATKNVKVLQLHMEFEKLYQDSLNGIEPALNISEKTIAKFSPEQLIKIIDEVLRSSVKAISEAVEEVNEEFGKQAKIALDEPIFVRKLHKVQLVEKKREVYVKHQVNDEEPECSSPSEVFSQLTQYNKKINEKFKATVNKVEDQFEVIISKLMQRSITKEQADEMVKSIEVKY